MVSFERAMVVSYRLSIVTVELNYLQAFSRNLPLNVSDAQINKGGHFRAKFGEEGLSDEK